MGCFGFDGTDDVVTVNLGTISPTASHTFAALIYRGVSNLWHNILDIDNSGGTSVWACEVADDTAGLANQIGIYGAGGEYGVGAGAVASGAWSIVAGSKVAGTTRPRLHRCQSGGAWTHADSAGNTFSIAAGAASGRFGLYTGNIDDFNGRLVVACWWDAILTDLQIEALSFTSFAAWRDHAVIPVSCWKFKWEDGNLVDVRGGADESSRVGTATAVEPPSWDWGDVAGTEYTDTGTALTVFTPSGTDTITGDLTDTGTVGFKATPSSSDIAGYIDSGTVGFKYTPSGSEFAGVPGSRDTIYAWYGDSTHSGVIDAYTRQLVRLPNGRVYAFIVDDYPHQNNPSTGKDFMLALRADAAPIASTATNVGTNFEVPNGGDVFSTPDVRYDPVSGHIKMVYQWWRSSDNQQQLRYAEFDPSTDTWVTTAEVITTSGLAYIDHAWKRSFGAFALSLDSAGVPHVVYGTSAGVVNYKNRSGGTWSSATQVSTGELAPVHFQSVIDRTGIQHVVWVRDSTNGTQSTIRYCQRSGGSWITPETVNDVTALTVTNFDQTPSIVVNKNNDPIVLFLRNTEYGRWRRRTGTNTWTSLTDSENTHAPTAFAVENDLYFFEGHSIPASGNVHPAYQVSTDAGSTWGSEKVFTPASENQDGSASVRYDPLYDPDPSIIDWFGWDERNPDGDSLHKGVVYYIAVTPAVDYTSVSLKFTVSGSEVPPSTSQMLYPISPDIDAGGWTPTPLWSRVDEVSLDGLTITNST